MRKTWKTKNLNERPAGRVFVALALAASLAAFGCTTNRTPGNGEPVGVVKPGVGPAPPTTGVTGSSSGSNPPMFSSSTYVEALPSVNSRASRLPLSPDEAAAVMAGNQFGRGVRVLGPSSPGATVVGGNMATGQFQNPAMSLNPIVTVNSSINSAAHLPAVSEGAGGGGGGTGAVVSGTTVVGTTGVASNATVTGSAIPVSATVTGASGTTVSTTAAAPGTGAAVFLPSTAAATPTTAAPPFTPGNFAAGTVTPTASSGANATPTVSTSPVAATVSGTPTTNTTSTSSRRATTTTRATSATVGTASGNIANPVRVTTDANGKVIISNSKDQ